MSTLCLFQKYVCPYIVCIEPENLGGGGGAWGLEPPSPPCVYTLDTSVHDFAMVKLLILYHLSAAKLYMLHTQILE